MREDMQISVGVDAKVELLIALSEQELKQRRRQPGYTPQMARIGEIIGKFHPKPVSLIHSH